MKKSLGAVMVYLDANVLIYPLVYNASLPQAAAATKVLRCVESGGDQCCYVVFKLG